MKRKMKIGLLSIFFSVIFLVSCEEYPGYDDYVTDQLVSITSYNTASNFKSYKTFTISDSVAIIKDDTVTKALVSSSAELQKLYDQVKKNLIDVGYTYNDSKNADLGIALSLVKTDNVYVTDYPYWWYDYCYWYFWDCGYYPYYPYSYPQVVGGYTSGSVLMDMFDLKNQGNSQAPSAIWTGAVRGLYVGQHTDNEVNNAISDCFNQTKAFQK